MGDHRRLEVWHRALALAARIDVESRQLPRGHAELADQIRRAALSIPTNLAERCAKGRDPEFGRFVTISIGSAAELDSLLAHALAVRAMADAVGRSLLDDLSIVRKMLFKLRRAVVPNPAECPEPGSHDAMKP